MKIIRDGIEVELTYAELREAYNEFDQHCTRNEIFGCVENECMIVFDDERPSQEFLNDNGFDSFEELVDDIVDEYRIHCDNYDCFGMDKPSIKPFVIDRLDDYRMYDYAD